MRVLTLSIALVLGFFQGSAAAEESRPFTVHDLVSLQRLSDPQVSPDGRQVVFVLRSTDLEADRGRTDLWMVGVDGSGLRQLTHHEASESSPRWAPDGGSLYFLSSRSGSSQVWNLPLSGGEARPVTQLPLDVGGFVLSPKGGHLAVILEVFPDCEDLACTTARLEERADSKSTGQVYDRLFMRHWDHWKDGRRSQLFVVPVAAAPEGGEESEPTWISRGLDADIPSKPFGGTEEITFSPDGGELVFAARIAGQTEPWSTNFDLWAAPVDASAAPRNLTADNPAWDTAPAFSPDGKTLAYKAMRRPGYESDRLRIVLMDWASGERRVLTEAWDRSPGEMTFSPDGRTIYAAATDLGQRSLFAISVADGAVRKVIDQGSLRSVSVAGNRLIYRYEDLRTPSRLYSAALDGSDARPLTDFNRQRLDAVRMGEAEQFTFEGWNGETVHAYMVKPADYQSGKKYPLAFLIHGGPQGSFGNSFHYRWNPQTYAGAGYVSVMVDFHGSTGYGQAFTDSIAGDWGGKPLEDLRKGLTAAVERYPWIDASRACALGASYGGYMINWIAGNWADGFRCLVNHDGVFDQRSMYYTTEELWFPEWEHGGPYWASKDLFEKHNPVEHVERWRTPMLVIHGALDYRVPETQGIGAFTALQRRGIPSRFLYFPDENHWVLRPANSIQWHEAVLGWLDQWTEP